MPRWPRVAILIRPMQKARLPSRAFRTFRPEFAKFFKECQRPPSDLAGGLRPNADKRHVHESFFKLFPLGRILPNGNNVVPFKHSALAEWRCNSTSGP